MHLRGVFTAIITPFKEDGSVDEDCLKKLIDFNIENGVSGIVPCGTTGESPTLSHEEHDRVIELTISHVNKRVLVIAGTGSNSTAEAIRLSKHAEEAGADALLIVNPYYNKPTQEGLYRHFKAIADSVKIAVIVYNIKGRTGVNVETKTLMRIIKDCPNVKAVKEASGDLSQMKDVIAHRPEGFSVLSGDDNMALDLIKAGGDGVISVASNVIPDRMADMVGAALSGDLAKAEELHNAMMPFFKAEFIETNPIPIKCALAMKGMCKEIYRLPMCELSAEHKQELKKVMEEMKII
ncbi:MAG: 4-hydroxy-tetrahydrodipicolinate synthase [Nanoarchaeota archaeon]|nr:4-hydroxy-tetrahydrodipicolinate synthase [Nanoarchaeota archaeon]MBU1004467.1 4-hydroxy-tetrahydrodipicolinate synthase [Nanoarchaeota archaeon]MBU1946263.1 4-hydroxy-tetrahydrodipicolinate synthase [Nanoarchaeota archaeon]